MILSDISIKRPVLATVVSLLLVVLGTASYFRLPVREYPDIDPPVISVSTVYSGAAADVVETRVTQVLEQAVSGIEGLKSLNSSTREGRSNLNLEFHLDRDIEAAANDVRDAVSRAVRRLPKDVDAPVISKQDADSRPIMWISLFSERYSALELTDYTRRYLVDRFSVIPGVGSVIINGERRYAIRVWLDRKGMAARQMTIDDITEALRKNNVEFPTGRIESVARELSVRMESTLRTAEEFRNLPVKEIDGYQVRLGEVAVVEVGAENARSEVRFNGQTAVGLGIIRQSKSNTVQLAEGVRAELELLKPNLPLGVEVRLSYDESVFISESIYEIFHALGIAIALVIAVIFVFLRSIRATLIPVIAIPVSIIGSMTALLALGFSVNVLTLLALVLAIGLVVDDAIVVLENIHRRIEAGEPPLVAAYRGARQITFAVISSTLVLIAVFVPISFMEGSTGRLFTEFGIAMAASVMFSGLVALTLTPMMCSKILADHDHEGGLARMTQPFFDGMIKGYGWILERALRVPVVVLGFGAGICGLAYVLWSALPKEFVPVEDRGAALVSIVGPEGSSFAYTREQVILIENKLKALLGDADIDNYFTVISPAWGGPAAVNRGFIFVRLKDWGDRPHTQQEIVRTIFPAVSSVPGVRASAFNPPGIGQRSIQAPVQLVVGGPDHETVKGWVARIVARAEQNRRLLNVDTNFADNLPQLRVSIDRRKAATLNIPIEQVGRTLEVMLGAKAVTTYTDRAQQYDVIVQARAEDRAQPGDLENIFIRSGNGGQLVPLSNLVTMKEFGGPPNLNRVDRLPAITVSASLTTGYTLGEAIAYMEEVAREELPAEARVTFAGETRDFKESGASLYVTFAFALLVVFLVMAAQFESWIHPFIIMLTVPLGVTGAMATILWLNSTLNIYSQIGMILLIGIMTKNGILIVEFANQLRAAGKDVREAVWEAAVTRLRPILMTAISTIAGAVPLVMGTGAGVESRAALAWVVIGGLAFSTILTLFVIPVVYLLLARFTRPINFVADRLSRMDRDTRRAEDAPAHAQAE
ncbi:MAG: efflux RND transporter permease subunit [Rhodospirillales bacterium]|nr:efflux RND transporter permease subunit [Rhodospirillales bacterium]